MCLFFLGFSSCTFTCDFLIFYNIKAAKHIWDRMLPPAGRNWQLIYPNGMESAVKKALIAESFPVKS
jgi:hypothetical protein